MRRLLVVSLALVAALVPLSAHATGPAAFVDLDDDGVYDPADLPLDQFLAPDAIGFNAYAASGPYKPTGRPVGIVIQDTFLVGTGEMHQVIATGHIRVHGNVVATRPETSITFVAVGNDVDVAPGVAISGSNGSFVFETTKGGRISVGDGVKLANKGDLATIIFDASGPMTVGQSIRGTLRGGGYSDMFFIARDGISVGPDLGFRGPGHGGLHIVTYGDLVLDAANIRCGYVDLEANSDDAHPAATHLRITDGHVAQTYHHGDFRMLAGVDQRTQRYAADAIVLDNTPVSIKAELPLYVPDPIVR